MIILISGGTNNGKSYHAKKITANLCTKRNLPLYYVATAIATTQEMKERIAKSQKDREGLGFTTIELTVDIEKLSETVKNDGIFLINNVTALLSNEFSTENQTTVYKEQKVIDGLKEIVRKKGSDFIIISDYMFSNSVTYDENTDNFCRALGRINAEMAKIADVVIEVSYHNLIIHKGEDLLAEYTTV